VTYRGEREALLARVESLEREEARLEGQVAGLRARARELGAGLPTVSGDGVSRGYWVGRALGSAGALVAGMGVIAAVFALLFLLSGEREPPPDESAFELRGLRVRDTTRVDVAVDDPCEVYAELRDPDADVAAARRPCAVHVACGGVSLYDGPGECFRIRGRPAAMWDGGGVHEWAGGVATGASGRVELHRPSSLD